MTIIDTHLKKRAALALTSGAMLAALTGATATAAEPSTVSSEPVPFAATPNDGFSTMSHCIDFFYINGQSGRRAFMENLCPNTTVYGQIIWSSGGNSARCRLLPYQRASSYRAYPAMPSGREWHTRPSGARNDCT